MIELCDIRKTYQVGEVDVPVLKGISLHIARGEYVALMGSSGSGKTTLMNLLGSLDRPTDGTYRLDGTDVSTLSHEELAEFRNRHVGFVFQNFNLLPRASALDNVLLPTLYATDRRTQRERVQYARRLLETVGLSGRLNHAPNQLSGGERQRVAIARALINRPKLLLADEPTGNLDSKTEAELLDLFRRLNEEHGITLVVVTHDAEVARQADRVIHMKDGVIAKDVQNVARAEPTHQSSGQTEPSDRAARSRMLAASLNAIIIAVLALRRNKLRTALTMLGVIIGVASVVNVMELSSGASRAIEETVASMGATSLTVSSNGGRNGSQLRFVPLKPDDVRRLSECCPTIQRAAPIVNGNVQLVRGNRRWVPKFSFGTSQEYFLARNWETEMGQPFSDRDVLDAVKVCVIGRTVAEKLFGNKYPIGQEIRANDVELRVLGVLSPKGGDVIGNDQDDVLIAPWTTFKFRVHGNNGPPRFVSTFDDEMPYMQLASQRRPMRDVHLHQIYVQSRSPDHVSESRNEIRSVLANHYNVDPDVFQVSDLTEVSRVTRRVVNALSALGLIIGGVSLLVGGVGIMNIMLVSVTERTREIGLRMAVGASRSTILRQFLIEATVLCLFGGLLGIITGHCGSMAVGYFMNWPTMMSIWAPLVAVGVAALIGILFGYYPALKASSLNPIDALRYE